jgi:hypothetical protein
MHLSTKLLLNRSLCQISMTRISESIIHILNRNVAVRCTAPFATPAAVSSDPHVWGINVCAHNQMRDFATHYAASNGCTWSSPTNLPSCTHAR